jgi:hypothetical protein
MKMLLITIVCLACASCMHVPKAFIQGDIRIKPPIAFVGAATSGTSTTYSVSYFNDGGTQWIKIVDAEGSPFDVYIDRRFNTANDEITQEPGTIYLNAYPARSNSVLVVDQERFKKEILKGYPLLD